MSLINDMLHDKQRRQQETRTSSLGARPLESNDANKRPPPGTDSYLHGKFDSMVMYNPYSKGEQPGVKQQIQGSLLARYGLMIGGGLFLAAVIHWAIIPSKSLIGRLIQNDPFYATASVAWDKAYALFQPTVPPVLIETSTLNPTPQPFLDRKPMLKPAAAPANWQPSVTDETTSVASQWLTKGMNVLLAGETAQRVLPNNTPEADELRALAAANGSIAAVENNSGITRSASSMRAVERDVQGVLADAQNYIRVGAPDEAAALLTSKLEQRPSHTGLRVALATLLIDQHRFEEAERVIGVGQQLFPEHHGLRRLEAQWYIAQNNAARAVELLLMSPPRIQDDPEYYSVLAAAYQRVGKHDLAAQLYNDLLKIHPNSARWWAAMGISLEASDAFTLSVNSYMRALSIGGLEPELRNFVSKRIKQLGTNGNLAVEDGNTFNLAR